MGEIRGRLRVAAALFALLFSLVYGIWSLYLSYRVPDMADWVKAAEAVRSAYEEGDVVIFEPPWAQEGAPLFQGMRVVTSETVDFYEVGKAKRVFVVTSLGGASSPCPKDYTLLQTWEAGKIRVDLYEVPKGRRVVYDFLKQIKEAKVTRVYGDRREECRLFKNERWFCGSEHPWQFVGRVLRDIGGAVREAIWAHPLNGDNPIEVLYPSVPVGKELVVHFGWTQRAFEAGLGKPVRFKVKVAEKVVLDYLLEVEDPQWHEVRIDLADVEGPRVPVTFIISTPDYQNRQLCFTADMWE